MSLSLSQGVLFTDFYQLTMAQLYFRQGLHERTVQFEHYFRSTPDYGDHTAGYCINAGMGSLTSWMREARFGDPEIQMLKAQKNRDGSALFADDFLQWLRQYGDFSALSINAVPEGRVVHPNTPLTVVEGPLVNGQLLETSLLAQLNYQTLIATRAARIRHSGRGQLLLDFGMRRGQSFGANAGSRAALIGGADYSSNSGLSHEMGIAPRGTHAHSLVQVFLALGMTELDAFRAYAELYPEQCLLLVDTVDTLHSGVPNAIKIFDELKKKGYQPVGVRLDSGDLAYLSIQVYKMLQQAGFSEASIALSNNLDEIAIWQIITQIQQEAPRYQVDPQALIGRLVFGVGTKLMTSSGAPALGGVYKLVSVQNNGGWSPAMKLSESSAKTPNPGRKSLWRVYDQRGVANVDWVALEDEEPGENDPLCLHHPSEPHRLRTLDAHARSRAEALLKPAVLPGLDVRAEDDLNVFRARRQADIESLDPGVLRLVNPHIYHVSLSPKLWALKQKLIEELRGQRLR